MGKYAIDKGHTISGLGTGAVGILKETDINRPVGDLVIKYLREGGHTVYDCTVNVSDNDLQDRVNKANSTDAEVFVSIHLNSGGGHGTETYIYNGSYGNKEENRRIATNVNNEVVNSCGFTNRGVKEANFYVLRKTKMKAILVELFFIDSSEDCSKYNNDKIARAIVKGLTGKDVSSTSTSTSTSSNSSSTVTSQTNSEIKVGTKVQVIGSKYANVDKEVPNWVKQNTYEVLEVKNNMARLSDINSWLFHKDLKIVGTSTPKTSGTIGVGSKVKVIGSNYATGEKVASFVYSNTYEVIQMSGSKALLGSIMSWVYTKDLQLVSGGTTTTKTLKVGSTVKVKTSAKKYATGQGIASFVYNNSYKVIQLGSDRALLGGIMSWVYKNDLEIL